MKDIIRPNDADIPHVSIFRRKFNSNLIVTSQSVKRELLYSQLTPTLRINDPRYSESESRPEVQNLQRKHVACSEL